MFTIFILLSGRVTPNGQPINLTFSDVKTSLSHDHFIKIKFKLKNFIEQKKQFRTSVFIQQY